MVGVKLDLKEQVTGWLAVFIMTVSAILSFIGQLIVSYFNQQVRLLHR
jgi:putative Mn2+ efflux pump MntP